MQFECCTLAIHKFILEMIEKSQWVHVGLLRYEAFLKKPPVLIKLQSVNYKFSR